MRILIDADGCPVVNQTIALATEFSVPCVILCDTAHEFNRPGAETIVLAQGADSVDFALVNLARAGDIVITQDFGLAAMCLARGAIPVHQDGFIFDDDNIGALLQSRHESAKIRRSGGRTRGAAKRTAAQNAQFVATLRELLTARSQ